MTKIYYIIGMMGVGKSSIGLGAARHIHIPFVDLDDYIRKKKIHPLLKYSEREEKPVSELWNQNISVNLTLAMHIMP